MESVQLKNITVGRRVKEKAEVLHCPSSCSMQFHHPGNKTEKNKCMQCCSVTPPSTLSSALGFVISFR